MDPSEIYALPQHINQYGELVVLTSDFAQLLGISPAAVEVTRLRLLYNLHVDEKEKSFYVPDTLTIKDALMIAESIN